MEKLAENLWFHNDMARFDDGRKLPLRLTVAKLQDGMLWLHALTPLSDELKESLSELGTVGYLYCGNNLHNMWFMEWVDAYPDAEVWITPGIPEKLPELEVLAELAEKHLELDQLFNEISFPNQAKINVVQNNQQTRKRIALAQDEAFHFYYSANLEWLRQNKVELLTFSPLRDKQIPENVDGIILGGGFPEVFAEEMSANKSMLDSLKTSVESGLPCYAECGGLMVMVEGLKLLSGKSFPMSGVVPGFAEMTTQLQHFGYCKVESSNFGEIRGHEFHYSYWTEETKQANLWEVTRHSTGISRMEGYRTSNLHASYVHLYFPQASSLISEIFNFFPEKIKVDD